MLNVKKIIVSKDTRINLSAVNTRNDIGQKDNDKRSFNFVIKGLAVSSMLFGSVFTTGLNAFASTSATKISSQQTLFDSTRLTAASVSHSILLSTEINGKKQSYAYPSRYENGEVFVPITNISKALGVSICQDTKRHTVTAKHGSTTVKVTVGSSTAYVNGKPYRLPVAVSSIQGVVMVPTQVMNKILGASVSIKYSSSAKSISFQAVKHTTQPVGRNTGQVVDGITVKYGHHTYAVDSQEQYDKVVGLVSNALKQLPNTVFGGEANQYFNEYLNGARWNGDRLDRSPRNVMLKLAGLKFGQMQQVGASNADIVKISNIFDVTQALIGDTYDPEDGSPKSAYDTLVRKYDDCDATAQVYSLAYDMEGFNTAVVASGGHASVYVQIHGHWFCLDGAWGMDDLKNMSEYGQVFISTPTYN